MRGSKEGGGRGSPRPAWRASTGEESQLPSASRALPRLPAAPHPWVREGLLRHALARPPPPLDPDAGLALPCAEQALGPPCGPRRRGVAVCLSVGPRENKGRVFVLEVLWAEPFVGCRVPESDWPRPGGGRCGHKGGWTSGGDLPPLVILWATPPAPAPLFSRVLELFRS